jgi:transaldolase/glucose-6-phosphate isomerase
MTTIEKLTELGQSLWYDNIQRRLLENGDMQNMIERGDIRGVTSNPSIFEKAIAKSADYDSAIIPLAWSGWDAERIFWQLAVEDIQAATDLFLPLYQETDGGDGYVSIEVSPYLAHDTHGTLDEVRHLWQQVDRPNLMVKIPATKEGVPAIRKAISEGINVNVTLIFSLVRYAEVMEAYLSGLEDRLKAGQKIDRIASVASFFVSRVDTKVDGHLDEIIQAEGSKAALASKLLGQAAVANAKLAYEEFQKVIKSERFSKLQEQGARLQRPLWASTSTKNPAYSDVKYVEELVAEHTVNTVPPRTLEAFRDHGNPKITILDNIDSARKSLDALESLGIKMEQVTQELEDEGVKSFADAFSTLLNTIDDRREAAVRKLGSLADSVSKRVARLNQDHVPARLWTHDPTLWTDDPEGQAEVKIRMGWLTLPETSRAMIPDLSAFTNQVRKDGITKILLLGMGGSSLAPEVLSLIFEHKDMQFAILDSTDPAQVTQAGNQFPPQQSLYVVSSKSGTTAEVLAYFHYFWKLSKMDGSRFIAITDPGTPLEKLAKERGFRRIFNADPNVGGRYSALTHFGLVPAGLMGLDVSHLLDRAEWMKDQCVVDVPAARNPGLVLGAVMGQAALDGRDKLTILADDALAPFGSWLEQLVAESSGKQGKGILPVDLEPVGKPDEYGQDRLFVYLRQSGKLDEAISVLENAGHPVLVFDVTDNYDLGAEIYRWEMAIAVACHIIGVNAFNQPNVQDSKDRTKKKIAAYNHEGTLDEGQPSWNKENVEIFAPQKIDGENLAGVLNTFLLQAHKGNYVAINAYLPRFDAIHNLLQDVRIAIRTRTRCATTVGFGPRFQHSTGQMHKGGPNSGLFIQIAAEPEVDVDIPEEGLSFGTLERAQVLGDYEALVARDRRILRIILPSEDALKKLLDAVK